MDVENYLTKGKRINLLLFILYLPLPLNSLPNVCIILLKFSNNVCKEISPEHIKCCQFAPSVFKPWLN